DGQAQAGTGDGLLHAVFGAGGDALPGWAVLIRGLSVLTGEQVVHRLLQAGQPDAVRTEDTDDVPGHPTGRIVTSGRVVRVQPGQTQRFDVTPRGTGHGLGQVHEPVVAGELLLQGAGIDVEVLLELERVRGRVGDLGLVDGDVVGLGSVREHRAVAVEDLAALGLDREPVAADLAGCGRIRRGVQALQLDQ